VSTQALNALLRLLANPPDPTVVTDPETWAPIKVQAASYSVRLPVAYAARNFLKGSERAWCDDILTTGWRRHDQSLIHLEAVVACLKDAGIEPLVLKGPLLARRHYQPPFLRKSSLDIDLGVRLAQIDRACEALRTLGYQQRRSLREAMAYSYDVGLLHTSMPRVELHFRLSHGLSGIPMDGLFGDAVEQLLPSGRPVLVLSRADELLHLILHFAHHRFPLLFNLLEIRQLWHEAPREIQETVVRKAIANHFLAPLVMTDIAFRVNWNEKFLPHGMELPKTWLHGRLTADLYRQCAAWSQPGFRLTLGKRLQGRWLDFQLTDRPSDMLGFLKMFLSAGWYRLRQGAWGTLEYPHFADPEKK
jgi:hypothetical protein